MKLIVNLAFEDPNGVRTFLALEKYKKVVNLDLGDPAALSIEPLLSWITNLMDIFQRI